MLTLYLARHGQTDDSKVDRFCGAREVPLNPEGQAMAAALAAHYGALKWEAIYSSPQRRALETAAPLAGKLGLPIETLAGLEEIRYGGWEGLLAEDILREQPEAFRAWEDDPAMVPPPGGETAAEVAARALRAIEAIRLRHPEGRVMAVTHKATIRLAICALMGIPLKEFRQRIGQPAGAVNAIEFQPTGALLTILGNTCHLGPGWIRSGW
jgi:broad specificity phosphatase PhoE